MNLGSSAGTPREMGRAGNNALCNTLLFCSILAYLTIGAQAQDENTIYERLFKDYDKNVRPAVNISSPVPVTFNLILRKILEFDPEDQSISFAAWLQMTWEDKRLVWFPRNFGGLSELEVRGEDVWIPDVELYNTIGPTEALTDFRVLLQSNGTVIYVPASTFVASCPTNLTDEVHRCTLVFGSWVHSALKLDLQHKAYAPTLREYTPSHVWELKGVSVEELIKMFDCCPQPYKEVRYTLELSRKNGK
ncbi:acetylcholine receptor subunit alpha-type acr-16 isoform X2 [Lingula anatina]|uniref:Acetylcholine receptor subunit alpha-type acr-16 isoform X2 n=1 Tax=Lingula anatina TaxID=7574 RepID=A0A1S3H5K1_LINAN|nr:acetylcholine receptor subunit alpha-type acr-16 isoform X2 [Lingula anatina]|eukprot:XP_013380741.1 acetylcholine receptor subunit alpha-type acr-16 isoform X2 [Lingula anatina]